MNFDCCLFVILIGLPGVGKTSFSRILQKDLICQNVQNEIQNIQCFEIVHLEYDALEEQLLSEISSDFNLETWQQTRLKMVENIEKELSEDKRKILVIDDNMFYRSMRKSIYRLAIKCNLSILFNSIK